MDRAKAPLHHRLFQLFIRKPNISNENMLIRLHTMHEKKLISKQEYETLKAQWLELQKSGH